MLAVFDVDGVVADVRHRLHHLQAWHSWDAFFDDADADELLAEGARLVADLGREHDIVWLTGRPERLREVTLNWMQRHTLPVDELHMRPHNDYRPAPRFKLSVLKQLEPRGIAAVIDDDDEVIRAALAAGYPAVLAEWVPRASALAQAQDRDGRT